MTNAPIENSESLSDVAAGAWPILMQRSDIITLKEAVHRTGKTDRTLRTWCKLFGISRQTNSGAPIEISAPALEMVMHGDMEALELLRSGHRHHPRVRRFFDHLGLSP
ncbi:hypothetical protein ACFYE9_07250 [Rhizobium leguminosarum]|uniref:Uncharacterized protein n=2 Tax=Rhizobium leguminosarum TaxID=384 RepID=A0A154IFV9_RHILE|nr:hypothetical protein [Rhizobium leguminosarum]KZA99305.1 hypothetical protein A4A59_23135 [Rhizobium leguminosarum]